MLPLGARGHLTRPPKLEPGVPCSHAFLQVELRSLLKQGGHQHMSAEAAFDQSLSGVEAKASRERRAGTRHGHDPPPSFTPGAPFFQPFGWQVTAAPAQSPCIAFFFSLEQTPCIAWIDRPRLGGGSATTAIFAGQLSELIL